GLGHDGGTPGEISVMVMGWPTPNVNPPTVIHTNATTMPQGPKPTAAGTTAMAPAETRSATSTRLFREQRADKGRMNTRDRTDVAPRTARSAPIIIGETPTSSPTSGINATRISRIANRASAANMCDAMPGSFTILRAEGFVPGSTTTRSWVWVVGCSAARSVYKIGTATAEVMSPIHSARLMLNVRSAPPACASVSDVPPRMTPDSSGPIICPTENEAVNHPKLA